MVSSQSVTLDFRNVRYDGPIGTRWDVLLRIVGEFAISVHERNIYSESEFPLVEFAVDVAGWLVYATDSGPEYSYSSIESAVDGLVEFRRLALGMWRVSAAHGNGSVKAVTTSELRGGVLSYLHRLRDHLLPAIDIIDYIDNTETQRRVRAVLVKHEESA